MTDWKKSGLILMSIGSFFVFEQTKESTNNEETLRLGVQFKDIKSH